MSTPWGAAGVNCFFALSGFLITLGLEREDRPMRSALHRFYTRRSLRIFPLYYLVLTGLLLAGFLPAAAWYFGYASNVYLYLIQSFDGPRTHFWSLAVEEQFYLLYPLLFFAAARRYRPALLVVLILASKCARILLDDGSGWSDSLLPVCGEYLLWGALAAVVLVRYSARLIDGGWLVAIGLALAALSYAPAPRALAGTPDGFGYALIVLGLWNSPATLLGRALSVGPLVYLGRISYGLYVFHNLVIGEPFQWLRRAAQSVPWAPSDPWMLNLAVTVALASASWYIVERPILALKDRLSDA